MMHLNGDLRCRVEEQLAACSGSEAHHMSDEAGHSPTWNGADVRYDHVVDDVDWDLSFILLQLHLVIKRLIGINH
jgi:hypothetical protein